MKTPHEDFDRDAKLDGLGMAFFSILSALIDEVAAIHPDGDEATRRIRSVAIDMATSVTELAGRDLGALQGGAIREETLGAIAMVFAATRIGHDASRDDGGDEVGPGAA